MDKTKLGAVEGRFADLIWANEPMTTAALVALAKQELDWKRTTTYTVLKKLCVQWCPGLVWLLPAVVITGCCAVCMLLEKHQPRVYHWLTGKTDREKKHGEA